MEAIEGRDAPVKTKAIMVDPETMVILWANEAAAESPSVESAGVVGSAVERVVPLAGQLGVVAAIGRVAATGEPYHVHADLIPTRRGSMVLAVSMYRLPEGTVLVLAQNEWEHAGRAEPGESGRAARGRR
ncbi:MAG: PAS domain-containing protein [Coriobacteriia bacterium]